MQRAEGVRATHLLLDIQELLLQSHIETEVDGEVWTKWMAANVSSFA